MDFSRGGAGSMETANKDGFGRSNEANISPPSATAALHNPLYAVSRYRPETNRNLPLNHAATSG
jgi:hypothetical protein